MSALRFDHVLTPPPWRELRAEIANWRDLANPPAPLRRWIDLRELGYIYLDGLARGFPYEDTIRVLVGTAPYTIEIIQGELHEGLELDEHTGVISGTVENEDWFIP